MNKLKSIPGFITVCAILLCLQPIYGLADNCCYENNIDNIEVEDEKINKKQLAKDLSKLFGINV